MVVVLADPSVVYKVYIMAFPNRYITSGGFSQRSVKCVGRLIQRALST